MATNLLIDYDVHLGSGRVWEVEVELPDEDSTIALKTHVIASNRDLAQYIAASIYPDYDSIAIGDEPLSPQST